VSRGNTSSGKLSLLPSPLWLSGWCFPKMEVDCWRFMVARARSVCTTVGKFTRRGPSEKPPRRGTLTPLCTVSGSLKSLNSLRRGFPVHLSSPVDPAHTPKRPAGQLCFLCPASSDQGRSRMRRVGPALSPYPASVVRARSCAVCARPTVVVPSMKPMATTADRALFRIAVSLRCRGRSSTTLRSLSSPRFLFAVKVMRRLAQRKEDNWGAGR
jgi:hypothetical protein